MTAFSDETGRGVKLTRAQFIMQMILDYARVYPGAKAKQAMPAAAKIYRDFTESEGIEFGDERYAWDANAAAVLVAEYEDVALEAALSASPVAQEPGSPDGLPFGIIDPKYAAFYTVARLTAWSYGYAIAMHGSFTRDLDLIAIPWTDAAVSPEELIHQVQYRTGCTPVKPNASFREHGRIVWTLSFPEFDCPRFVDFSIIPPATSAGVGADEIALTLADHFPDRPVRAATNAILALLSHDKL